MGIAAPQISQSGGLGCGTGIDAAQNVARPRESLGFVGQRLTRRGVDLPFPHPHELAAGDIIDASEPGLVLIRHIAPDRGLGPTLPLLLALFCREHVLPCGPIRICDVGCEAAGTLLMRQIHLGRGWQAAIGLLKFTGFVGEFAGRRAQIVASIEYIAAAVLLELIVGKLAEPLIASLGGSRVATTLDPNPAAHTSGIKPSDGCRPPDLIIHPR